MTAGKRKKGFTVKFDLSLAGVLGVGVVCFCIFFWMFLLGVWSGQNFLSSGKPQFVRAQKNQVATVQTVAKRPVVVPGKGAVAPGANAVPFPGLKKKTTTGDSPGIAGQKNKMSTEPEEDPAFFTVQVAAFKDGGLALKEIETWKKRGFKPFSRPPEGKDDKFTRVYIGNFDSMAAAKNKAEILARKGKIKPFIVLIPAG